MKPWYHRWQFLSYSTSNPSATVNGPNHYCLSCEEIASYLIFCFHFCPHRVVRVILLKIYHVSPLNFFPNDSLLKEKKISINHSKFFFKSYPLILTLLVIWFHLYKSSPESLYWRQIKLYSFGKNQKFLPFVVCWYIPSFQNTLRYSRC